MRQGSFTSLPDESGRVLDRLAGLEQVIAPDVARQCLSEAGCDGQRSCGLSHEVMLWIVLAMGLFTEVPIRQVFKRSRFARACEPTPSRSALCQGRQRLGIAPIRRLFERIVRLLAQPCTRGAFYHGYRLMGIDSTVCDLPDTEANEAAFGRPSGGHRGPGAFPQLRKVSLVELGTHVETAFVLKPCRRGEMVAVPALLKRLGPIILNQPFSIV
ncbi:MAG: transposase domain-containing protein [Pirellulaceae bacterium]|nr:transposase domain-containing protein [Pirellulaceae bacterium]